MLRNGFVPTLEECELFFAENGSTREEGRNFFNRYNRPNWNGHNELAWKTINGIYIYTLDRALKRIDQLRREQAVATQQEMREKEPLTPEVESIAHSMAIKRDYALNYDKITKLSQTLYAYQQVINDRHIGWVIKAVLMVQRYPQEISTDVKAKAAEVDVILRTTYADIYKERAPAILQEIVDQNEPIPITEGAKKALQGLHFGV